MCDSQAYQAFASVKRSVTCEYVVNKVCNFVTLASSKNHEQAYKFHKLSQVLSPKLSQVLSAASLVNISEQSL
jgi:hypothetical protein